MTQNNTTDEQILGWVGSSNDRGTIDIMWSSCITIILCCWVSTYPNVGSPSDKWYHIFYDKISLAMISILGPDFLFGIAFGQWSSARRSVKTFQKDKHLCNGEKWTYTHAFFIDMGGIHLTSPDFQGGFPINAEQLHYLVLHKHLDFPDMETMEISERNSLDRLSRLITVFQAFWFVVTEIQRYHIGLPMTTLELTALSFTFIMFSTSILWYAKPSITQPRTISTKENKTIAAIRDFARSNTHSNMPDTWYQTPLEFIGEERFRINAHWQYYVKVTHKLHLWIVSRPIKVRPWDRFPSDLWICPDLVFAPVAAAILVGFSVLFLPAWNFHFPTPTEQLLWRICSTYHAVFSLYGGGYYLIEMFRNRRQFLRRVRGPPLERAIPLQDLESQRTVQVDEQPNTFRERILRSVVDWIKDCRNISDGRDPNMAIPLRILFPVSITCALYVACRFYIYFEDFFSLRAQPAGVFLSVNKFIPFLVGP
ncbi:oxidoreductase [Ilyonectria robusta]